MKKFVLIIVGLLCLSAFSGCADESKITDTSQSVITSSGTAVSNTTTIPETTSEPESSAEVSVTSEVTEPVIPVETELTKSDSGIFHVDGVYEDDIITYFNEVVLDSEFENGGDSSVVQKWSVPIKYMIHGEHTDEDLNVLTDFVDYINTIDGFFGAYEVFDEYEANLNIYFCTGDELVEKMGESTNYEMLDGAVTFWYDNNEIYSGIICYRNDIEQETRNSVIIEEIYNGLGPIQDTDIRVDSIIYSGFTTPQEITEVDDVILRLLYHPDILCGMDADECEEVIRRLYY